VDAGSQEWPAIRGLVNLYMTSQAAKRIGVGRPSFDLANPPDLAWFKGNLSLYAFDQRDRDWATPLGLLFVDGGHAFAAAVADYEGWSRHLAPGGSLAFHDVFEDPAAGGQAPYEVWGRAVADGFDPVSTTGSLRVLRCPG